MIFFTFINLNIINFQFIILLIYDLINEIKNF